MPVITANTAANSALRYLNMNTAQQTTALDRTAVTSSRAYRSARGGRKAANGKGHRRHISSACCSAVPATPRSGPRGAVRWACGRSAP